MDLNDYIRILRRNWLLVVTCALMGLLLGGASALLAKPTYTAETQLFVATQSSGTVQELQQGNTFSQSRVQSYVSIVTTPVVLQPVIESLGLSETTGSLGSRVKATSDLNTVIITISVNDPSAVQAAASAQAVAESLIKVVGDLEKPKATGESAVKLSVITPAAAPASPSAPNIKLSLALGILGGVVLGIGAVVVRTLMDNRIRGEADVRLVSNAPILGGIAFDADAAKKPLLTQTAPQSPRAESFRQLRTNLSFANVAGKARSVLVTSSFPAEGKSTTAMNLAIALAQAGHSVCLVDADLRRPTVDVQLGLERSVGLTTALLGAADVSDVLQPWGDDDLYVLTSGQIPPNPSELLGSQEMKDLLARLEDTFDSVIVDAPPLLPVTDAAVLAQSVGGVVLVVGAQKARQQDLEKSLGVLDLVGANILGLILNRLPAKGPDAYAYGYYNRDERATSTVRSSRKSAKSAAQVTSEFSADEVRYEDSQGEIRDPSTYPHRAKL